MCVLPAVLQCALVNAEGSRLLSSIQIQCTGDCTMKKMDRRPTEEVACIRHGADATGVHVIQDRHIELGRGCAGVL